MDTNAGTDAEHHRAAGCTDEPLGHCIEKDSGHCSEKDDNSRRTLTTETHRGAQVRPRTTCQEQAKVTSHTTTNSRPTHDILDCRIVPTSCTTSNSCACGNTFAARDSQCPGVLR